MSELYSLSQPGAQPAVVLLHGAGATHEALAPLMHHLVGPAVVAPSLPGRAGSPGPLLTSIADMARAVAAWARRDHERVIVAGHSLGGALALELALTEPDLVCGLAMIASGARLRVHPSILQAMQSEPAASDWRACNTFDRMDRLGDVTVPTAIIYGSQDTLTPPKYQTHLLANIPGAEGACIDGAGHDIVRERPAEVAAALLALWRRAR